MNGNGITVKQSKEYHKLLDPFQDGLAYMRTGLIISQIQKELNKTKDIDKVIKKTKDKFPELS